MNQTGVTVPMTSNQKKRIAAIVGAIVAGSSFLCLAVQTITSTWALTDHMAEVHENDVKQNRQQWQLVQIFTVIDEDFSKNGFKGLSFATIMSRYQDAVSGNSNIPFESEHLTEFALRTVLAQLLQSQLIIRLTDGNYCSDRGTYMPRTEREAIEQTTKIAILHLLASEGGKYTSPELSQQIMQTIGVKPDEFNTLMAELIAGNIVKIDTNGKVWSAANPPIDQK